MKKYMLRKDIEKLEQFLTDKKADSKIISIFNNLIYGVKLEEEDEI